MGNSRQWARDERETWLLVMRNLDNILTTGSHWGMLSREGAGFELRFAVVALAAVWRKDREGFKGKQGSALGGHLSSQSRQR